MPVGERAAHAVTICTPGTFRAAIRLASSFVAHHAGHVTIHVDDPSAVDTDTGLERVTVAGPPAAPADAVTRGPWALSAALDAGHSPVVALTPTTFVARSLAPLVDAARRAGFAVVPRLLEPDDGDHPLDPAAVLDAGVVEPGLVACAEGVTSRRILRWWKHAATTTGAARAADLLPAFGAAVVRDAGLGVTRWNLAERPLHDTPFGMFAADAALRTCDLAGLRADHPPRWEDDGRPDPPLDGYAATLAWQHVVAIGPRP